MALWTTQNTSGKGWSYDESDLTYDMPELSYNYFRTVISWTKPSKIIAAWTTLVNKVTSFLLQEDGFYLLLEDGGKIIVEPQAGTSWNNDIKH